MVGLVGPPESKSISMPSQVLADAVLILHLLIVLFNIGSLPVIWIGWLRGWDFVRNFYFRAVHLLLIGFVAAESVVGAICPLTTWEDALREATGDVARYDGGFIAHWVHRLIYYDIDARIFIAAYVGFFVLVLLTFFWVKPTPPRWWKRASGASKEGFQG